MSASASASEPTRGKRKRKRVRNETRFATFNLQGKLNQPINREKLLSDMRDRHIKVAALQETGCGEDGEHTLGGGHKIILMGRRESTNITQGSTLGLGFFVSKEWADRIHTVEYINDRIALITFTLKDTTDERGQAVMIINMV